MLRMAFLDLFCSRVFPDRDQLLEGALELAATIASKSPVAVQGTKLSMVYARDHSVEEGLKQIVICLSTDCNIILDNFA